jgi:hypothetical protein
MDPCLFRRPKRSVLACHRRAGLGSQGPSPRVAFVLKISCLHSAQSNIAVFETARRALKLDRVTLKHRVRSDLLATAEKEGGPSETVLRQTADEHAALAQSAHGVLLTCSTLGPAVRIAAAELTIPVLRVDRALAEEAVRRGGAVIVLCAVGTTIAPTRAVFEEAAMTAGTGADVEVRLIPGAWDLFKAGRQDDYWQTIADAADTAAAEGAAAVALAQASMAGAAALARHPPLTSPGAGLAAMVARAQAAAEKSS